MGFGDMLNGFEAFFQEACENEIRDAQARDKRAYVIDFSALSRYDPDLADDVLDEPEEAIRAADEALNNLGFVESRLNPRFAELPEHAFVRIRDLRSQHIGNLVALKGLVKRASEVRPELVSADFECTSCGDVQTKEQDSTKLKSPYQCDCGNRRFETVDKELVDVQIVTVEENPQDIEGSEQPRSIGLYLREDLVDPEFQQKVVPGNEVEVTGTLQEAPQDQDSKRYDLYVEGNYLEPVQREFEQIEITQDEEEEIEELGEEDDIFQQIVDSIAPSIYGHERVKEAVALQLFSGVRKERPDGVTTRGDMHILLIGEPGTGKSQILQFTGKLAPKGKYVVGKSATGAGITATAVQDEVTGGWVLEAGALVLANKGIATVDEIDKMSPEDRSSLHEAMEQQTISVSKATIQATLQCQTAILAAGNPKYGRFDPYKPVAEQIDIGDTLLSRFDLIFPVKDEPDTERDTKLASHILSMHTDPTEHTGAIEKDLLQKYVAYAKRHCKPQLTEAAREKLQEFYVSIRNQGDSGDGNRSVPMTARQLEALVRLSEASARARMNDTVEEQDADRAIDLLTYCLKQIGVDPETGELDIDRIESGISSSERNRLQVIQHIIDELADEHDGGIPVEDVLAEAEEQGVDEEDAGEVIKRLKREGELFEPSNGHIQKL